MHNLCLPLTYPQPLALYGFPYATSPPLNTKPLYMANMFNDGGLQGVLQRVHLLKSKKTRLMILDDISSIIPAGRMTGLLGPPGSGKSSLLQALAGKLQKTDLEVWFVFWMGFTSASLAQKQSCGK